jgi:PAS domain S-box-containing protein
MTGTDTGADATDPASLTERYETIFRHSNEAIMIVDFETDSFVDVNPAACEMLGYSRPELLALDPTAIHPDDMDRIRTEFLSAVYEDGAASVDDLSCVTKSGETVRTEITGAVLADGETDGEPSRMVAMLRDVTERKDRKRELRQSFEEFEGILDNLTDLVFLHDPDGTMRYVNEAALERLGYTESELLDMTPQEFVSREDAKRYDDLSERVEREEAVTFEATMVTNGSEDIPVEIGVSTTQFRGEPALLSVARDISDRKERQRTLRRFKKAVEQTAHAVYITDTEGTIEYVNEAFERQTGYPAEEAVGRTPNILNSGRHDEALFADLWETILAGEVWEQEIVNERADGSEYYVDQTVAPLRDETGEIEAFVAVNTEITEQKDLERRLTEQRDDLDMLNQVLRHDIRNDLQLITAYGEMAMDRVDEGSDVHEYLEMALDSADHAVDLTRTARDMATAMLEETDERQPVNLRSVLESELDEIQSMYPRAVVTIDAPLPPVDVTANGMLDSVFRNLLKNAIQHNDNDVPKVEISATERGDNVVVRVADNGPGIPDSRMDEIFGKGEKGLESQGTGLGLFLVKTLVDDFGGEIRIEDGAEAAGLGGAVFAVELPIAAD